MKRTILGAFLMVVLWWGIGAGRTLALGPGSPEFPRTPPQATELPPGVPPADSSPSPTPIRDFCRFGRPLGCWSSFNGFGCRNLRSDVAFIFGSCRTFFSEPCLKSAPPSALPPWAGLESGYGRPGVGGYPGGAGAGGRGGCGCE